MILLTPEDFLNKKLLTDIFCLYLCTPKKQMYIEVRMKTR